MITGHSQMLKSPLRSHPVSCRFDNYALPSPTPENREKIIDRPFVRKYRSHDARSPDHIFLVRRLFAGRPPSRRRQSADKPVGRRHFADRQTADCRRSDGGQTTDKTALCRRPDDGLPAVCRRTNKQCNEVFHADRVFYWHTEIACGFILSHRNHRNHGKSMANAPPFCVFPWFLCAKNTLSV